MIKKPWELAKALMDVGWDYWDDIVKDAEGVHICNDASNFLLLDAEKAAFLSFYLEYRGGSGRDLGHDESFQLAKGRLIKVQDVFGVSFLFCYEYMHRHGGMGEARCDCQSRRFDVSRTTLYKVVKTRIWEWVHWSKLACWWRTGYLFNRRTFRWHMLHQSCCQIERAVDKRNRKRKRCSEVGHRWGPWEHEKILDCMERKCRRCTDIEQKYPPDWVERSEKKEQEK